MKQFTLSKQERLTSRKDIEILFTEGQSITKYPIRLVWRQTAMAVNPTIPVQAMFSVSKKVFPNAVDRNRAKRLMREGYRLLKPKIFAEIQPDKSYHLGWIYTGKELLDLITIQKSIADTLDRWILKCNQG
jgi:ribonuclease P protein component